MHIENYNIRIKQLQLVFIYNLFKNKKAYESKVELFTIWNFKSKTVCSELKINKKKGFKRRQVVVTLPPCVSLRAVVRAGGAAARRAPARLPPPLPCPNTTQHQPHEKTSILPNGLSANSR